MREHQATVSPKTGKLSVQKQCLAAAPLEKGRRPGHVLYAPCRGFGERPWFDALFSFWGAVIARLSETAAAILAAAPPLPLDAAHWQKIVAAIGLSKRQAEVAELMLRDLGDLQIAAVLGINKSTIDTHTERIGKRTGTNGRMQLAMHVLAVPHRVLK